MTASTETPVAPASSRIGRSMAMTAMGILLVNVLLVAYDVLLRWVLRSPQSWVADIANLSYPIALACCIPAALESGHMIAIRFLGEAIGPRTARVLDFTGSVLMSLFLALIAWKVAERAGADWNSGYRTATIKLPLAPTSAVLSALLVLAAVVQLRLTWRAWTELQARPAHG